MHNLFNHPIINNFNCTHHRPELSIFASRCALLEIVCHIVINIHTRISIEVLYIFLYIPQIIKEDSATAQVIVKCEVPESKESY